MTQIELNELKLAERRFVFDIKTDDKMKLVVAGNQWEYMRYRLNKNPIRLKYRQTKEFNEYTEMNFRVVRQKVRRYIDANPQLTKFLTLTIHDRHTSLERAHLAFANFARNMKRINPSFQYICFWERQKRGAIHYHVLCNLQYIKFKDLNAWSERYWSLGFIKLRRVRTRKRLAVYMTKYLTKDYVNVHVKGKKKFFRSWDLVKPSVLRDDEVRIAFFNVFDKLRPRWGEKRVQPFGVFFYLYSELPPASSSSPVLGSTFLTGQKG